MKQLFLFATLAVAVSATSCNKTYHCTCVENATQKTTYAKTIKSIGESTARPQCEQYGSNYVTCTLSK